MMNHRNGPPVDIECWKGIAVVFVIYAISAVVIMLAAHIVNIAAVALQAMGIGK